MTVNQADADWARAVNSMKLLNQQRMRKLVRDLQDASSQLAVQPPINIAITGATPDPIVVPGDPSRVYIGFSSVGGSQAWVGPVNIPTATAGGIILNSVGILEFFFYKHGPLVGQPWYVFGAITAAVTVLQVTVIP